MRVRLKKNIDRVFCMVYHFTMSNTTEIQRMVKKLLKRYSYLSKTTQYDMVAEDLGISSRLVRYLESDPNRVPPKPVEKLIRIMAQ